MNVICDSSFWLSFYDRNDNIYHKEAIKIAEKLELATNVYMPWPSMYLLINTKFLKEKYDPYFRDFRRRIRTKKIITIDDVIYKEHAYAKIKENGKSMVDYIVEEIYLEKKYAIDYLISFKNVQYSNYLYIL